MTTQPGYQVFSTCHEGNGLPNILSAARAAGKPPANSAACSNASCRREHPLAAAGLRAGCGGLEFTHAPGVHIFAASSLAIIPLARLMGKATEHLAQHPGRGNRWTPNATFGNAAELITPIEETMEALHDVVKASITGSIVGNILLVFGLSAVVGGARYQQQKFNVVAANLGSTLLLLSAIALVIPAIFQLIVGDAAGVGERKLSLEIAVVLLITYVLSLVFTLKTHRHLYGGAAEHGDAAHGAEGGLAGSRSVSWWARRCWLRL